MKKVLVIDDEHKIRRIYSGLLESDGYMAMEASNAVDAYEILKREKVDLVLLDINMPQISGGFLYQVINTFQPNVKIIVCSVRPFSEQKRIIKGAVDYYDKSEGLETLRIKIKRVLKDSKYEEDNRC